MTPQQKKYTAIGILASLAFAWGWSKNRSMAKRQFAGVPQEQKDKLRAEQMQPGKLASALVFGPFVEEWAFRGQLQGALSGLGVPVPAAAAVAAAAFGASHSTPADKGKDFLDPSSRTFDAAVGGLLYSTAFAVGGLPGAVAAHGLHNLGASLGWVAGIQQAP